MRAPDYDTLETKRHLTFNWAIGLTIGLVVCVPMIVCGFIFKGGYIAIAVLGIVLAVSGFYGSPLVWIHFGTLTHYAHVRRDITSGGARSVKMLAEMYNKNQNVMANDIKTMITKSYLPGYVVLDNERIINKNEVRDFGALEAERAGTLNLVQCPFCAAKFQLIHDVGECPYCKSEITIEMLANKKATAYNRDYSDDTADNVTNDKK